MGREDRSDLEGDTLTREVIFEVSTGDRTPAMRSLSKRVPGTGTAWGSSGRNPPAGTWRKQEASAAEATGRRGGLLERLGFSFPRDLTGAFSWHLSG